MQRSRTTSLMQKLQALSSRDPYHTKIIRPPCDIFINHRGIDTKRTISGLLYYHLSNLGFNPFLDSKKMEPGDKLFDKIDAAISECKLGIAVFSPHYCDSYFCLHELSSIVENRKRVLPIFCDVKPSELKVGDNGSCSPDQLRKFQDGLETMRYTVGLRFDSHNGDWMEFLTRATNAIIENLIDEDQNQNQ